MRRARRTGLWREFAVWSVPLVIAAVGYGVLTRDDAVPDTGRSPPEENADSAGLLDESVPQSAPADDIDAAAADVRTGSMRETMLETEDGNRRHIAGLAIRDAGYECSDVGAVEPVGASAIVWRASCEDGGTFWVGVDELDRLTVDIAPVGDVHPGITAPVVPQGTEPRRLELENFRQLQEEQ